MTTPPGAGPTLPDGNQLLQFLAYSGWSEAERDNPRWHILHGPADAKGAELEIVIPKNPRSRDLRDYVLVALRLLSTLSDESLDLIATRARLFDRDVLAVRNIQLEEYNSIALRLAAAQVQELKQLVAYSACSERDPRPYFPTQQLAIARDILSHYRFGHTFSGSFGFTIEAPIVHPLMETYQLRLDEAAEQKLEIPPIERRVMERILHGLSDTKEATRSQNVNLLIDSFTTGFNSNMCHAIVGMSRNKDVALDYSIIWSPKLPASKDIQPKEPIRLSEPSYDQLEYAAKKLRELKFDRVKIRGLVVGLSSRDAPLGARPTERSVVVRWTDRPDGKPINIIVPLDKDQYVLAHKAHLDWRHVQVTGVLRHIATVWRLSEPSGFKLAS